MRNVGLQPGARVRVAVLEVDRGDREVPAAAHLHDLDAVATVERDAVAVRVEVERSSRGRAREHERGDDSDGQFAAEEDRGSGRAIGGVTRGAQQRRAQGAVRAGGSATGLLRTELGVVERVRGRRDGVGDRETGIGRVGGSGSDDTGRGDERGAEHERCDDRGGGAGHRGRRRGAHPGGLGLGRHRVHPSGRSSGTTVQRDRRHHWDGHRDQLHREPEQGGAGIAPQQATEHGCPGRQPERQHERDEHHDQDRQSAPARRPVGGASGADRTGRLEHRRRQHEHRRCGDAGEPRERNGGEHPRPPRRPLRRSLGSPPPHDRDDAGDGETEHAEQRDERRREECREHEQERERDRAEDRHDAREPAGERTPEPRLATGERRVSHVRRCRCGSDEERNGEQRDRRDQDRCDADGSGFELRHVGLEERHQIRDAALHDRRSDEDDRRQPDEREQLQERDPPTLAPIGAQNVVESASKHGPSVVASARRGVPQ